MNLYLNKNRLQAKSFTENLKGPIILALTIILNGNCYAGTGNETASVDSVKATYIYNILRFVSWPDSSPLSNTESLTVCLFKKNTFALNLDAISKRSVGNKDIKLKTIMVPAESAPCHLVFIDDKTITANFKDEFLLENNDSILLGNNIEFVKNGGLFGFYIEGDKVGLAANRAALAETDLEISSLLIEVCKLHGKNK